MPIGVSDFCKNMEESATLAMSEKAKKFKSEGKNVIGLGVGEPDINMPKLVSDAIVEALNKNMTKYTPVSGTQELKQAIVDKLKRENQLDYQLNQIIVSNGAKHSLYNAFQAILNRGDEVIIFTPCWVSYPEIIKMAGGVPVYIETQKENNFLPDISDIKKAVTSKTKAILINNPSNPLGTVWDKDVLDEIAKLAVEEQFYIVSDEIYEKLIFDGRKHYSIANYSEAAKDICILINGVSKSFSMTGLRIGYAAGPVDVIKAMNKYQSQSTSNPNSLAQHAACVALNSNQEFCDYLREQFQSKRDIVIAELNKLSNVKYIKPEGAFYVMLDISNFYGKKVNGITVKNSIDFANLLLENQYVAVVPGDPFFANDFVRISYAVSNEDLYEAFKRINNFLESFE